MGIYAYMASIGKLLVTSPHSFGLDNVTGVSYFILPEHEEVLKTLDILPEGALQKLDTPVTLRGLKLDTVVMLSKAQLIEIGTEADKMLPAGVRPQPVGGNLSK